MIRVAIVDDEPLSRSNLTTLLRRDRHVDVVCECGDGLEALAQIRRTKPDLVFLDVEMPELDGFDVLEMLGADVPKVVVFVTAYDAYALRAFDAGAIDYLLKPFDDARFDRTLERAKERLRERGVSGVRDSVAIRGPHGMSFVKISEIDWIEAADYYARLHVGTKSHLVRRSMSDLERDLDASAFCRIHRSTIVRLDCVRGLATDEHGDYDVLLEGGTALSCSRRYRKQLLAKLPTLH